jgi:hypothetical protein
VKFPPNLTHKNGLPLRDVPCFHLQDKVKNTSWHVKHLFYTKALQNHATANEGGGRTKVQVCLY